MSALLGLDIGTTTIKALLYDTESGHLLSLAARPTPVEHPAPTWSQHDPGFGLAVFTLWNVFLVLIGRMNLDRQRFGDVKEL